MNVSEGTDEFLVTQLRSAAGRACVDIHTDPDHHRSVFTLASERLDDIVEAARGLTLAAADAIDLAEHDGIHPRFGAVDVVPFVTLSEDPGARDAVVEAARSFADWVSATLAVPTFLYDEADPDQRTLPDVRRGAFTTRDPDFGPRAPHPRLGAMAVGARPPMIAVNVELTTSDLAAAREIASSIRATNGGLDGVRALAFPLASRGTVQVSMNLVDLATTGMEPACQAVADAAHNEGIEVARVELVGLVPGAEYATWSPWFRSWTGYDERITVEGRVTNAVS